jgi:cell division protein FtsZ
MEFIVQNAINESSNEEKFGDVTVGQANIKVIGVGGAGGNIANWLFQKGINGAEIVVVNTDQQHLDVHNADRKILIGRELTKGLGAGGFPQKGMEAARESVQDIKDALKGSDMVFVTAGMGGGTGTGAAHVVAKIAKEQGSIVIGTVTMPFALERARIDKAEFGLQELRQVSDSVIVIDNNRLVSIAGNLPIQQAFAVANELVSTMIKAIVETIAVPSLVNLDYADVRAIMTDSGVCSIGVGESDAEHKVEEATRRALTNPLLDISYKGATGALIHVEGGSDLTLDDVNKIGDIITDSLDKDANVIWGARINEEMQGKLRVMTIVAGVNSPYILGKVNTAQAEAQGKAKISQELGIDVF